MVAARREREPQRVTDLNPSVLIRQDELSERPAGLGLTRKPGPECSPHDGDPGQLREASVDAEERGELRPELIGGGIAVSLTVHEDGQSKIGEATGTIGCELLVEVAVLERPV